MKLPSLPFLKKQTPKEYYLALLFQDERIQAVVFEESQGQLRILNTADTALNNPIENLIFSSLLNSLDKVISTAESVLPHGIQTHKTIFGLKQTWVDGGQIKKDYLLTLKKACEELDLQPIGFLIFPEAIAHLLQKEEGAPVSGILIEIGTTTLNATLLRAGRIVESRQGPISESSIPKSVDHLLAYFADVEILPSRIILADYRHDTHLTQHFIHHQWSKQLPFLHVPQITPLTEDFESRAVLHGTATQLGFSVVDAPLAKVTSPEQETAIPAIMFEREEKEEEPKEEMANEEQPEDEQTPAEGQTEQTEETSEESADGFGFVQDKDVAEDISHPTSFASHIKDNAFEESEDELADQTFADIPEDVKDKEQGFGRRGGNFSANGMMIIEGAKRTFVNLAKQAKEGNLSFGNVMALFGKLPQLITPLKALLQGPKFVLLIPVVLVAILLGIVWYIFGLHAKVTLTMNAQNIEAAQDITITTKDSTDLSTNSLGGAAVSVDENGSTTTDATGTKDTGDKAKGTVTLYNSADSSKTFTAGTTITSENGLKFTIDKDVTVASASGDIFSGTKPGTQDVSVTASTFGTDYNLPSGTKFSVSGTTSVAAKNANAFSGGTKKSLKVISANDISKAQDDLINTLQDKAKQDMQKQNGDGKTILPIFTLTTLSKKSTDKNAGDEGNSVTLTATVTYESIAYASDDVKQLAQNILKSKMSPDMTTTDKGIQAQVENASANKDGSSVKATLKASAGLLPKLDKVQIAKELAGKSFSDIKTALSDIKQLDSADVTLKPNLFFLPHVLPRISSHIDIDITQ